MSMVMMALGVFRFGISGQAYQSLQRSAAFRWSKAERVGRAPAMHYVGPDAEEITIEGVIYPHFRGGLRQVDIMRLRAGTGIPMMMVDGLGWVWKQWVVIRVEETKSVFMADGAPKKIEFKITLQAYGRDRA